MARHCSDKTKEKEKDSDYRDCNYCSGRGWDRHHDKERCKNSRDNREYC